MKPFSPQPVCRQKRALLLTGRSMHIYPFLCNEWPDTLAIYRYFEISNNFEEWKILKIQDSKKYLKFNIKLLNEYLKLNSRVKQFNQKLGYLVTYMPVMCGSCFQRGRHVVSWEGHQECASFMLGSGEAMADFGEVPGRSSLFLAETETETETVGLTWQKASLDT